MRLYSRGQVIVFCALSAMIVAFLAMGFGLIPTFGQVAAAAGQARAEGQAAGDARSEATLDGAAAATAAFNGAAPAAGGRQPLAVADLTPYTQDELENIDVYGRLNSGVVNITTEIVAINWYLEPVPQDGGSGSGSIIDTRGYVLTNNHVVADAYKLYVNLADGSQYEAKVIGTDPENDLAVIKFEPPRGFELTTVPYGDSAALKVGQKVLAIGNPFGFERTLTVGVVSGLGRPIQTNDTNIIRDMIQTDASINPGNSGGPLLDSLGRMIGINTMIYTNGGSGSVGIGFAVPVNTAKRVVAELMQYGHVRRGWIDATFIQLFPALVNYAKLPVNAGLLVSRVKRGGAAERAGLRQGSEPARYGASVIYLGGDIITKVDGLAIKSLADLYSALEDNKPGDKVAVEVLRGGKTIALDVVLAERAEVLQNNN